MFEKNHGFTISQTGLSFLGLMVGMVAAILSDPLWKRNHRRLCRNLEARTGSVEGASEPEYRLPPTILGAFIVPVGLLGEC